ncbi:PREDICTED: ret finger protein-like 4A [Miniopterus natalensis]|uniref:ret finger protein-like 4A n=1 Tax=Miniopterus natalensis TaxID=291302 RepID=UPI0007A6EEED|nr:PREDICTED: ret finger protein-like 4A [Miniopterus natalensis]
MAGRLKEASRCPVCLNYLENPVNLKCGYICCLQCVPSLPKEPRGDGVLCLGCSKVSQKGDIRPNSQLGRLVSKVKALEPQLRTILQMNPRIRKFQVDMTLDVHTANNYLILSEDLRRVSCGYFEQRRLVHPGRFNWAICVLGSPRFASGRHYWEVDVGTSREWSLGVCTESAPRQGEVLLSSERGFWTVSFRDKDLFSASTEPFTVLLVSPHLHRVAIFLDVEMGTVSFYHVGDGSHVFTFPKISASEPLCPFFGPANPAMDDGSCLTICPG